MTLTGHILILLTLFEVCFSGKFMKITMKAVKCETPDSSIFNGSFALCRLRPTRDGTGLTSVIHRFGIPAREIWIQVTPYYKYGTIFRYWQMNVTAEICSGIENMKDIPLIGQLLKKTLEENIPGLLHKCPYQGEEGFRNVSVDKVFSSMFPQVIPKGEYKIVFRGFVKDSQTFARVALNFLLDSNDPLKSMKMGRK